MKSQMIYLSMYEYYSIAVLKMIIKFILDFQTWKWFIFMVTKYPHFLIFRSWEVYQIYTLWHYMGKQEKMFLLQNVLFYIHTVYTLNRNPLENYPNYRTTVISMLPNLKSLDFAKGILKILKEKYTNALHRPSTY